MSDYITKQQAIDVLKKIGVIKENDTSSEFIVYEINRITTLDETKIIRKPFERVVERLEKEIIKWNDSYDLNRDNLFRSKYASGRCDEVLAIKEILKEECGING